MFRKHPKSREEGSRTDFLKAVGESLAIVVFDPDGKILSTSSAFRTAMGYEDIDLRGKHHRIFMPDGTAEGDDYEQFWKMLRNGELSVGEFQRVRGDGEPIWLRATYQPVQVDGKTVEVIKTAHDITARRNAVHEIKNAMIRLGNGDLTCRIEADLSTEYQDMAKSFNGALDRLEALIGGVAGQTAILEGTTVEMETGATDLSRFADTQVKTLEDTQASIEEIASEVASTSDAAILLDKEANASSLKSREGTAIVRETTDAMREIETVIKKVSETTHVIEGFAFQTKLLSLNAAVEAARAGEAGKGFAIVASEVRDLAAKSTDASKRIADLMTTCETAVGRGTELAIKASETLADIEDVSASVATSVKGIANSTRFQAESVRQIEVQISELGQAIEQLAKLSDLGLGHANTLKSALFDLSRQASVFEVTADTPADQLRLAG